MKLEVPYFSQFNDVTKEEWKQRSCSIVCLGMALKFFLPEKNISIDNLIEEGISIGGYGNHGWIHNSIALLSHNYCVPAYCEEFRSVTVDAEKKTFLKSEFEETLLTYGIQKIVNQLKNGNVVIVSVPRNMEINGTFHTVLLIGFEEGDQGVKGFYYHDPDSAESLKSNQFIEIDAFKNLWRKLGIFIGK